MIINIMNMTKQESNAINIARFILVVGILFVHFPISYVAADGINLTESDTPMYNLISSRFFLSDTSLSGLFLLSGYLFFIHIPGEYSEKLYFKKINTRLWSICVPYLFWNFFDLYGWISLMSQLIIINRALYVNKQQEGKICAIT